MKTALTTSENKVDNFISLINHIIVNQLVIHR